MSIRQKRYTLLLASMLGLTAAMAAGFLTLRPGPAEAQGIMAVPACQCSAPTSILGSSTTLVNCLCGGTSCVISQDSSSGKSGNLMQCVR